MTISKGLPDDDPVDPVAGGNRHRAPGAQLDTSQVVPSAADARLVELLLEVQQEELAGTQADQPNLLTAVVAHCPADYLWAVGSSLIGQGEERTMLGARLVRELPDYKERAAEILSRAWAEGGSPTFEYWMVSAFAFLPADLVIARLLSAAGSPYAATRDAAASALVSVTQTTRGGSCIGSYSRQEIRGLTCSEPPPLKVTLL